MILIAIQQYIHLYIWETNLNKTKINPILFGSLKKNSYICNVIKKQD